MAETLRSPSAYPEFVRERRRLLADAMTDLLDAFRPSWLDPAAAGVVAPDEGERLVFTVYGSGPMADDLVWVAEARAGGRSWRATFSHGALRALLADVEAGRGGEFILGGEVINVDMGAEEIAIPFGPLMGNGSLVEWGKVVDRELGEIRPGSELPHVVPPAPWEDQRVTFGILDSE